MSGEGAATDPLLGKLFENRYEVISQLGQGGMGNVYRARHVQMDRLVALKVIRPEVVTNPRSVKRFFREMKATSRIEHPNTISVYDFGQTEDGEFYLAMELLDGRPLSLVVGDLLPIDRVLKIATGITRALAAAHSEGIIHRDLKPENIILINLYGQKDHAKVLDFGIARFLKGTPEGDMSQITAQGVVVGTPLYMAPEQITGETLDHRADLYALGVLLYELLVGDPPYMHDVPVKILYKHLHDPIPLASAQRDDVPDWLDTLVTRLLAKDPHTRPASAEEVLSELERHRQATPGPALVSSGAVPPPKKRSWAIIGVMVALALSMALGGWLIGAGSSQTAVAPIPEAEMEAFRQAQKLYAEAVAHPRLTREDHEAAAALCRQALEQDPKLVAAGALLADLYIEMAEKGWLPADEAYPKALATARQAVSQNPGNAQAHGALANATLHRDWNWNDAEREYQLCLTLDPSYAPCHRDYALRWLVPMNQRQPARDEIALARRLEDSDRYALDASAIEYLLGDYPAALLYAELIVKRSPSSSDAHYARGRALTQAGRIDEAIEALQSALALEESSEALAYLAYTYSVSGQMELARQLKSRLLDRARNRQVHPYDLAVVAAGLAQPDEMFSQLERAVASRSSIAAHFGLDPVFDEWRADPRAKTLREQLGLPSP